MREKVLSSDAQQLGSRPKRRDPPFNTDLSDVIAPVRTPSRAPEFLPTSTLCTRTLSRLLGRIGRYDIGSCPTTYMSYIGFVNGKARKAGSADQGGYS